MKLRIIKNVLSLVIIIFFSLSGSAAKGQDVSKYQVLFIYNFTKYIEWPSAKKDLVIGAFGKSNIYGELESMVKTKGNNKLKAMKVNSIEEIEKCDIVFLAKDQDRNFKLILEKTKGKSILLVSESPQLAEKGAGISFYLENSKLRFKLNKSSIEARSMKVSQSLLSLAKVI